MGMTGLGRLGDGERLLVACDNLQGRVTRFRAGSAVCPARSEASYRRLTC